LKIKFFFQLYFALHSSTHDAEGLHRRPRRRSREQGTNESNPTAIARSNS
jgi:hypothetical protein